MELTDVQGLPSTELQVTLGMREFLVCLLWLSICFHLRFTVNLVALFRASLVTVIHVVKESNPSTYF